MKLFKKVAIVGPGLIGGSMALAIKKKRLAKEVIAVSRSTNTLTLGVRLGAIDRGSRDIGIIKDCDLVVLATPANTIIEIAPLIAHFLRPGCIVTDVGSTKKQIVNKLDSLFTYYIGSHPLAGSEKKGIENATANLFEKSLCILTPTKKTSRKALNKIKVLWESLGAKVVFLSPYTHDRILSFNSHLPHIAAFTLMNSVPKEYLAFSTTSLKDMTRIAFSDSNLWLDIFLSNKNNMIKAIETYEQNLKKIKSAIRNTDSKFLYKILQEARLKRELLG